MGDDLELRQRIERFDVDAGAYPGYFVEKLASDNGWARSFAERVLAEYRRYAYLACTADHVVVPSDHVDMAWHQHLLDTEQYWGVFCKTVLSRPLHHRPNKGGGAGRRDQVDLYRRTLRTYADVFGRQPPADVWPTPARRCDREAAYWIVPKRRLRVAAIGIGLAMVVPATVAWTLPTGNAATSFGADIWHWDGNTAYIAFTVLGALALAASMMLRRSLLGTVAGSSNEYAAIDLDPYDAAILTTNTQRAVNTAVAALVRDNALVFDQKHLRFNPRSLRPKGVYRLVRAGMLPVGAHPLECAVYDAVANADDGTLLSDVHQSTRPIAVAMLDSLRQRGLLRSGSYHRRRVIVALPLVLFTGAVVAGMAMHRLGAFTIGVSVIAVVMAIVVVGVVIDAPPQLTAHGAAALDTVQSSPPSSVDGRDDIADGRALSWIIALHGAAVMKAGSMSVLHDAIMSPASMGGGGQGVKTAGCGGRAQYSGARCGNAGGGCGGGGCGG
jgi:uncharacterized protein (TIGR04222 family)